MPRGLTQWIAGPAAATFGGAKGDIVTGKLKIDSCRPAVRTCVGRVLEARRAALAAQEMVKQQAMNVDFLSAVGLGERRLNWIAMLLTPPVLSRERFFFAEIY